MANENLVSVSSRFLLFPIFCYIFIYLFVSFYSEFFNLDFRFFFPSSFSFYCVMSFSQKSSQNQCVFSLLFRLIAIFFFFPFFKRRTKIMRSLERPFPLGKKKCSSSFFVHFFYHVSYSHLPHLTIGYQAEAIGHYSL